MIFGSFQDFWNLIQDVQDVRMIHRFTSSKMYAISLIRIEGYNVFVCQSPETERFNNSEMRQCNHRVIGIQKSRGIRLKIHYQLDCASRNCTVELFDQREAFISDLSAIRPPARPNFRDRDNNDKLVDNKPGLRN